MDHRAPALKQPWHKELNSYHWFVLMVASLGWLFDTMDQQLFALARQPAMNELLVDSSGAPPTSSQVSDASTLVTSVFLIGWATGGLVFGIMGDRFGRARTMLLTILMYSLCTGLSAFSTGLWDFAFYRFLTGLGVGGEFAVGVALVAEVMPDNARPFALGLLQALSAVGNITAALINNSLGELERLGQLDGFEPFGFHITAWRAMFVVGTLPALMALIIRRRLKEPEQWLQLRAASGGGPKLGSYAELLGDSRWRNRALVGLLLATSGVIGVWGIGFFSYDLIGNVFGRTFRDEAREARPVDIDRDLVRLVASRASGWEAALTNVKAAQLLSPSEANTAPTQIWPALDGLKKQPTQPTVDELLTAMESSQGHKPSREEIDAYLSGSPETTSSIDELANQVMERSRAMDARLTQWKGYTSLMQNFGAFFGIYGFSLLTHRVGRRWAFATCFILAGLSTALVFSSLDQFSEVFWMVPLMGFCQLSLFGGYAIYFPELFPTRLRSTGTSFCYNVGRFVAAVGPLALGKLTSVVYSGWPEPMRPAGVTMCLIFVLGLMALPFAPETRGKPLPE
jgi:MFS family permease